MSQELPQVTYEKSAGGKKVSGLGSKLKINPILKPNIPAEVTKQLKVCFVTANCLPNFLFLYLHLTVFNS